MSSLLVAGSRLNDGEWHDVRFLARENFTMLTVDGDEASAVRTSTAIHITSGGTYHFGGIRPPRVILFRQFIWLFSEAPDSLY